MFLYHYLGKSISKLDYPAITICSQGLIQKVVDMAVNFQKKNSAKKDLYSEMTIVPKQLVRIISSPDPEVTVEAQVMLEGDYNPCNDSSTFARYF